MSIDSSTISVSGYQAEAYKEPSPKTSLLSNDTQKRTIVIVEKPDNLCKKIIPMGLLISLFGFFIGLGIGYSRHYKYSNYIGAAIGDCVGWVVGLAIGYFREKK